MAVDGEIRLLQRQGLTGGNAQLPFDQIQPGDHFCYGMFDLQAGVHFHEGEAVAFNDEFHRAGADIADRLGGGDRRLPHRRPHFRPHAGGWGFLDDFLVPALDGAIPFEQMHGVAVAIGEDLDFNVARAGEVAFHQHPVIAEAAAGFALGGGEAGGENGIALHNAHALAAAAGGGFDQHGIADFRCCRLQGWQILCRAVIAGHQRHAGLLHQRLGLRLAAHGADGAGGRADEGEAGGGAGFGEIGIFRQEAVAGMHCLGAAAAGDVDQAIYAQVAFARCGGADAPGFIGEGHMQRVGIGIGINRDGGNAHATGGADDAAGDFAAIGDQQFAKHGHYIRNKPKRVCATGAFRAADRPRPSTMRVSAGSMMPSSHSRAVA